MASGRSPGERPRAQVAVRNQPGAHQPRASWMRHNPKPRLPPALRSIIEQLIFAGPMIGVLGIIYSYHLTQTGSPVFSNATGETVRRFVSWHGHMLHSYYITPLQDDVRWAFGLVSGIWMIGLIATLTGLGVRMHLRDRVRPRD